MEPFKRPVLWHRPTHPDNYQINTILLHHSVQPLLDSYSNLVLSSLPLSTHLSSIFIFIAVFAHLHLHLIHSHHLISATLAIGSSGYCVWEKALPGRHQAPSVLVFLLLLLSPALRTLTLSTDSDSIWALTACLLILNILLGDYRLHPTTNLSSPHLDVSFPSALSLNAAIFASVVLGSRLSSNADAFALILFALQWFVLFPIMRRDMMRKHPSSYLRPIVLNFSLAIIALIVLYPLSNSTALIYFLLVPVGSGFGLPAVYCALQRYKRDLRGPWDCAVPKLK